MILAVSIILLLLGGSNGNYASILKTFTEQFRAPNPLPIQYNASRFERINLMKECSKHGLLLNWMNKNASKEKFLLIILHEEDIPSKEKPNIDQQIYFLTPKLNLHEKYVVNDKVILQLLGTFENNAYYPQINIEQYFTKRRNSFQGIRLVGLTDESQETGIKNLDEAIYLPSNNTYDVTNHLKGSFYGILKYLEKRLNFTTKIYKRKAGGWGMPIRYPNGSIEVSDGMVKDVMHGKADMIAASLSILYSRFVVFFYRLFLIRLMQMFLNQTKKRLQIVNLIVQ